MTIRTNTHGSLLHNPSSFLLRHAYVGVGLIALVTVILLYYSLGGRLDFQSIFYRQHFNEPSQLDYDEAFRVWQLESDVDDHHHHHHGDEGGRHLQQSHSHDNGVQFVLRESALGEPEFIGRNQVNCCTPCFIAARVGVTCLTS